MLKYYRSLRPYKYQLTQTLRFDEVFKIDKSVRTDYVYIKENGTVFVTRGYAWDGATGFPDIESIMMPSLVHDALTQLMNEGIIPMRLRPQADKLLYKMCLKEGMNPLLARCVYGAVRLWSKIRHGA